MRIALDHQRAAAYLARANLEIIKGAGARRQGYWSRAAGSRAPSALAGGAVRLEVLSEAAPGGSTRALTAAGYKTARRVQAGLASRLPPGDRRALVIEQIICAVERVGALSNVALEGGGCAHSGGVNDGGVTTRIKHAARYRRLEAYANGWPILASGKVITGAERVLLPVQRRTGQRQEIKAFAALLGLCVEAVSAAQLLRRHHWPVKSRSQKQLIEGVLATLDQIADCLGYPEKHS